MNPLSPAGARRSRLGSSALRRNVAIGAVLCSCVLLLVTSCGSPGDPTALAAAELVAQGHVFGIDVQNVVTSRMVPVIDPTSPLTRDAEQALMFELDHNYRCAGTQSWRSARGTVYVAKVNGAWKIRYLRSRQDDTELNRATAWKDCQ